MLMLSLTHYSGIPIFQLRNKAELGSYKQYIMTQPQQKIQPNSDVIFQVLGDETVLLHIKTEEYYTLDETGTRMWQLLAEHGDPEPVIAQLLEEFEVDKATVRRDLTRLIDELRERGLLNAGE